MTDIQFWNDMLINEHEEDGQKFLAHDDTVVLVHQNTEALLISAKYAIDEAKKRKEILWQWDAVNTGTARAADMQDVGGLRNHLCVFKGMRVMLLKNLYRRSV